MALRPCKECKREISSGAQFCPHCGSKTGGTSIVVWLVAIISVFVVIGYISDLMHQNVSLPSPTADIGLPDSKGAAKQSQEPAQASWSYSSEADKMGRGTTEFASLDSANKVEFAFPYNGGSQGTITLRNSPKYGKDAIFQISNGQILCDLQNCYVTIKVDNGPPIVVYGNQAADGSSNVVFLPYATLLRDVEKASVLRIEANFYREGSQVFEFHPQGLDVRKLAATK